MKSGNTLVFSLFSRLRFAVSNPVAVLEAYCFQSNFYVNYDVVPIEQRKINQVNKIGARIDEDLLSPCWEIVNNTTELRIFKLGKFDNRLEELLHRNHDHRNELITEFNDKAIRSLLQKGIGLSKATKVMHTFHPEIIPIIDNQLQKVYLKKVNPEWIQGKPEIFIDYYDNLDKGDNMKNLTAILNKISKNNLRLTKVRIFDILWWSYLKSKNLNKRLEQQKRKTIKWSTITDAITDA